MAVAKMTALRNIMMETRGFFWRMYPSNSFSYPFDISAGYKFIIE
jgi:hypothetical protein